MISGYSKPQAPKRQKCKNPAKIVIVINNFVVFSVAMNHSKKSQRLATCNILQRPRCSSAWMLTLTPTNGTAFAVTSTVPLCWCVGQIRSLFLTSNSFHISLDICIYFQVLYIYVYNLKTHILYTYCDHIILHVKHFFCKLTFVR